MDGNRPSSAASAFKVPAPKKPVNPANTSRKPGSAGGPKVGGKIELFSNLDKPFLQTLAQIKLYQRILKGDV